MDTQPTETSATIYHLADGRKALTVPHDPETDIECHSFYLTEDDLEQLRDRCNDALEMRAELRRMRGEAGMCKDQLDTAVDKITDTPGRYPCRLGGCDPGWLEVCDGKRWWIDDADGHRSKIFESYGEMRRCFEEQGAFEFKEICLDCKGQRTRLVPRGQFGFSVEVECETCEGTGVRS